MCHMGRQCEVWAPEACLIVIWLNVFLIYLNMPEAPGMDYNGETQFSYSRASLVTDEV